MTTFRDKGRRPPRSKRQRRALFQCGSCGKRYSNPLGHACSGGGDFEKRRRRQKASERRAAETAARQKRRQKETDARRARRKREDDARRARRERENEAARARKKKAAARPPRPAHDWSTCRDADCERQACEAFREGKSIGFDEGVAACPRTHTAAAS